MLVTAQNQLLMRSGTAVSKQYVLSGEASKSTVVPMLVNGNGNGNGNALLSWSKA